MFYLDNWQSTGPDARPNPNQKARRGLNENYGRELMELHTLGVDGGYTQQDVTEVARCFTGWTIVQPQRGGGFEFAARMHDPGEKHVLGVTIPAGGGKEDVADGFAARGRPARPSAAASLTSSTGAGSVVDTAGPKTKKAHKVCGRFPAS